MTTLTANVQLQPDNCVHKLPSSCRLTALPICCACQDQRPHASSYRKYIDGVGFVNQGTRQERYCWQCKVFWNNRVEASSIPQADTHIPDRPDQTVFLNKWYDWHRGYRVETRDDGTEERHVLEGERLADAEPGRLPRTNYELAHNLPPDGERDLLDVQQRNVVTQGDSMLDLTTVAEEDRLFDPEDVVTSPGQTGTLLRPERGYGLQRSSADLNTQNNAAVATDVRIPSNEQQVIRRRLVHLRQNMETASGLVLRLLSQVIHLDQRQDLAWQQYRSSRHFLGSVVPMTSLGARLITSSGADDEDGRRTENIDLPGDPLTWDQDLGISTNFSPGSLTPRFNARSGAISTVTGPNRENTSTNAMNIGNYELERAQEQLNEAQAEYNRLIERYGSNIDQIVPTEERFVFERARGRLRGAQRRYNRATRRQQMPTVLGTREDIQRDDWSSPITTMFTRYREHHDMRQRTRESQIERNRLNATAPAEGLEHIGNTHDQSPLSTEFRALAQISPNLGEEPQSIGGARNESTAAPPSSSEAEFSSFMSTSGIRDPEFSSPLQRTRPRRLQNQGSAVPGFTAETAPEYFLQFLTDEQLARMTGYLGSDFSPDVNPQNFRAQDQPTGGLDRLGTGRPTQEVSDDAKWVKMECKVCLQQVANVACVPCGHCAMCIWCADEWAPSPRADATAVGPNAKCPVCRARMRSKMVIFGSEQEGKRPRRKFNGGEKERSESEVADSAAV